MAVMNSMKCYLHKSTHPFNHKIRSRIFQPSSSSSFSSGSEHDAESPPSSSSSSLSYLVQNFLEDDSTTTTITTTTTESTHSSNSDSDGFRQPDPITLIRNIISPSISNNADLLRNQILSTVIKAVEIFSIFKKNKSIFHRNVMAYLREIGYNAGVCKIRWTSTGGNLTAGNYEFIDVISPENRRYIIDCDFAGEFVIARETERYFDLRCAIPRVFVGESEDLKSIIRLMCDEGRQSLRASGLSLPPWRKNRYMQMKWLGSYRRTTNQFPATEVSPAVECREVGFEVAGDGGRLLVAPVMRR